MKNLKFAILGAGIISHRFVKGFRGVKGAKLFAVASRDLKKAEEYAEQYNIPLAYGSYEEMLEDPNIDVVYIATPPFLHFEQVMMCLKAGKHVICEKPFMQDSKEIETAFLYAKTHGLVLMEAMKAVFLPTTKKIKEWIEKGMIGTVRFMEASYCYRGEFEENHWVYQKELAGGGMYDVGVYAVAFLNEIANSPIRKHHRISQYNKQGSDDFTQIIVQYDNDIIASMRGAIGLKTDNIARIYGNLGKIEIPNFWKTNIAYCYEGENLVETYKIEQESEFTYQIQEIIDCIQEGQSESKIMSEEASLKIIRLIESD